MPVGVMGEGGRKVSEAEHQNDADQAVDIISRAVSGFQIGEHVFSPFLGYGEADIFTRKAHQTKRVRYSVRSGTKDMIRSMTSMATRKGMAARAMSSDRSSAMELAA